MTEVRDAAISFEARKIGLKKAQTRKGTDVILTLAVHPDEVPPDLWDTWVGQRYQVAMVALSDQDEPEPGPDAKDGARAVKIAGALCRNERFWKWVGVVDEDLAIKWVYAHLGINSRTDLRTHEKARAAFFKMYDRFVDAYKTGKA